MPDSQNTKQNGPSAEQAATRITDVNLGYLSRIIEEMRARLLDLTRRNRLISTPLQGRRAAYLRVIDAHMESLFQGLQGEKPYNLESLPALEEDPKDEKKKFQAAFARAKRTDEEYREKRDAISEDDDDHEQKHKQVERELKDRLREQLGMNPRPKGSDHESLAEHARQNGIAPSYRLEVRAQGDHNDANKIQTLLLPEDLERLAGRIYQAGKESEEETGVNILQGAFGFLEWNDGSRATLSPLITMPISIKRTRTRRGARYSIRCGEGAATHNRALFEKLDQEHDITDLPKFDEEKDSIDGYFEKLREADFLPKIHGELRRFIAFGRFPSAQLAMYEDLAKPKPAFLAGLIKTLFPDEPADGNFGDPADDYDVDAPDIERRVPRVVMDADASQFSVLVDIADGKNLAVEGPPGTGKSQTIVNAIAAAMAAGKKVLFVAEKRAALDVVYSRLDALGVGEFAWLLTATKAQRRDVIESIGKRLEIVETNDVALDGKIAQRTEQRNALKSYIEIVSSKFEGSGMTVHRILGERIKHHDTIAKLPDDVVDPNDDLLDVLDEELWESIREFDKAQVAADNAQPYWRILAVPVHPTDVGRALAHCEKIVRGLRNWENLDDQKRIHGFRWWNVFFPAWWRLLARNLVDNWKQSLIEMRLNTEKFQLALLVGKGVLPQLWGDTTAARTKFRNMAQDSEGLQAHSACRARLKDIARCQPLSALHTSIAQSGLGAGRLEDIVRLVRIETWANKVRKKHGAQLQDEFRGRNLSELRAQFAKLDEKIIHMSSQELRHQLARVRRRNLPPGKRGPRVSDKTEKSLIDHQLSLNQRFKSPRYLAKKAGKTLQMLKPCWMMSPLAVAQYVDKEKLQFDLCIIDEASQMLTENAVGALMRSKQVVVVGDEKQLPPTRFFLKRHVEDDESMVAPDESILRRANAVLRPRRQLKWHYRSRDSRLINFSNRNFYRDRLIVFPAVDEERPDMGVSLIEVKNSSYKSGANAAEVEIMKTAILNFMAEHPNRSLGVVTMNRTQANLLDSEFQFALADDAAARRYVEKWETEKEGLEKFFIKNIENVQGDERDVIFIGTVYGAESPGGPVPQRFGPINHAGGERRLNVLFSRAKKRIVTFSAMHANDIHGNTPGARILHEWLTYAATGLLGPGPIIDAGGEPDNPFEEHVIAEIEQLGCEAVPQVGVRGYFIDIGVKHPAWPHGYLLGVECDGAAYHSSKSARERDRLRQEVLEGLGWKFHRIWSTDWFYDPAEEVKRLDARIRSCLNKRQAKKRAKQHAEQQAEPCEPASTALVPKPLALPPPAHPLDNEQ